VFDNALLEDLPDRTAAVVERAVIEATTNAIRHGHATSLDIGFGQAGSQLVVRLKDNGNSQSGPVTEGLGLSGIRNTVQAENGTLTYSSQPTGFEIDLKLPVAV
jgi:signal transduction histidine kinase